MLSESREDGNAYHHPMMISLTKESRTKANNSPSPPYEECPLKTFKCEELSCENPWNGSNAFSVTLSNAHHSSVCGTTTIETHIKQAEKSERERERESRRACKWLHECSLVTDRWTETNGYGDATSKKTACLNMNVVTHENMKRQPGHAVKSTGLKPMHSLILYWLNGKFIEFLFECRWIIETVNPPNSLKKLLH